jgi:hypothetical protein
MSCDQCARSGIAKFCSMGQPCFQCTSSKRQCTYGVPLSANNILQPFKVALSKVAQPPKKLTSAEAAAGAGSRAGSPAYVESNAENSNEEEAKQAALRKKVAAMNKNSQLNNKNNKNKKRKSRKATRTKQKGTRKLKHK